MLSSVISFFVRLVLVIATSIIVLSLMAVALVTMVLVIVWSLLTGRKPKIDVSGFARARQQFRGGRPAARQPMGEVVDVEVREVPDKTPDKLPEDQRRAD